MSIIISLCVVVMAAKVGYLLYSAYGKRNILRYPFCNYNKVEIPYITIDVQGKPLNMIIDSGAAISIITKEALDLVSHEPCMRKVSVAAVTPEKLSVDMVTIPITINGRVIKEDFMLHPVEDLANFKIMHGIVAHGILGNEFFEKTGCKIDYKKHSVTLH